MRWPWYSPSHHQHCFIGQRPVSTGSRGLAAELAPYLAGGGRQRHAVQGYDLLNVAACHVERPKPPTGVASHRRADGYETMPYTGF